MTMNTLVGQQPWITTIAPWHVKIHQQAMATKPAAVLTQALTTASITTQHLVELADVAAGGHQTHQQ